MSNKTGGREIMFSGSTGNERCPITASILVSDEALEMEKGFARGPERGLLSALLFDGIVDFMNYAYVPTSRTQTRYKEAYHWVNTRGGDYIFSFDNVCEGLGIDPASFRYGLLSVCANRANEWRRARRNF